MEKGETLWADYKKYLFVRVNKIVREEDFKVHNKYLYQGPLSERIRLPDNGKWQIIGKGDQLDSIQWMDIIEWDSRVVSEGITSALLEGHKDYERTTEDDFYVKQTATESGHSLLRSLNLEPQTTIILKKQ